MKDKKHIDRLFQEKLKDFEADPSDVVWENINSELVKSKKDRKVIPLWWKIAGIAAGFILLLTIGNLLVNSNDSPSQQNNVVDTESNSNSDANSDTNIQNTIDPNAIEKNKVASDNDEIQLDDNVIKEPKSELNPAQLVSDQNDKNKTNNGLVSNKTDPNLPQNISENKNEISNNESGIQDVVTENKALDITEEKNDNTNIDKQKADALINTTKKDEESTIAITNVEEIKATGEVENTEESEKLSLNDELKSPEEAKEVAENDEKRQRWSIAPHIAPVYFNSFGSGSSIDDQFKNNSRSGDINVSYGVATTYNVNSKLSLRAGINQVKLGYSTNDVVIYNNIEPTIEETTLKNVALNENGQNFSFLSANDLGFAQIPGVVANNISSSIDQKLGFIEIPVELEYKISDKKVDVSLIGGFSTLILNQNEIYSTLQGQHILLGEATNINKTSFSANLGLGVNFEISKKFNLNLEPVLKYQLNTFNDTSGNFNPYFIGVYTGFSFKF